MIQMKNKVNELFDNATDIIGVARRIAYSKEITLDQAIQALKIAALLELRKELDHIGYGISEVSDNLGALSNE